MHIRALAASLLVGLTAAVAPMRAQAPSDIAPAPTDSSARLACFHPRPLARCRSFATTEASVARLIGPPGDDGAASLGWELGWMVNRSPNTALGGALHVSASREALRVGLKVRYRRWVTPTAPLDIAPGVLILNSPHSSTFDRRLGFTGHIALSSYDLVGMFAQVDVAEGDDGVKPRVFIGARLGSGAGVVGGVVAPLIWAMTGNRDNMPGVR